MATFRDPSDIEVASTRRYGDNPARLPKWLRKDLRPGQESRFTDEVIHDLGLNTICQSGKCPNKNECFSQKTATFMIMGEQCTRNCHYCSVSTGKPTVLDADEPKKIAMAVNRLGLRHVVITSVTRDDLEDEGVEHFKKVVYELRKISSNLIIEVLTPDFKKNPLAAARAFASMPINIFNHNIETVKRIHPRIRPQGSYQISLDLIKSVHNMNSNIITKSGAMLGVGESHDEVEQTLIDLVEQGCQMLTLGQYMQPSRRSWPIQEFISPQEFQKHKEFALKIGFEIVEAGPFVRSSYHAKDTFDKLLEMTKFQQESVNSCLN